jgi:hypothetical protein
MGFQKRWDMSSLYSQIRALASETRSAHNDGFTAFSCKQELYLLKCYIEDQYKDLPTFSGEEEWEQSRIINKLKQK